MEAIVVLGVVVLYFVVLIACTVWGYKIAKRRGLSPGRRRLSAAIGFAVVFLPVFWDTIPTLWLHRHYCETEGGFTVYKTLEQWKRENPGVAETLDRQSELKLYDPAIGNRFWATQRFYTDVKRTQVFHAIERTEHVLVDAVTQQLLARSVNFWRGRSWSLVSSGGSLDDFRQMFTLGWGNRECEKPSPTDKFTQFRYEFRQLGGKK